jgi:hypothetical protein
VGLELITAAVANGVHTVIDPGCHAEYAWIVVGLCCQNSLLRDAEPIAYFVRPHFRAAMME